MSLIGNLSAENIIVGSIGNIHITDEALQEIVNEITAQLIDNEEARENTFIVNEADRQATFELNERIRQAEFNGAYTNLLKDIAEENSTTDIPTQFPCKKVGMWYYNSSGGFKVNSGFDCYLFEASAGERLLISNYVTTGAVSGSMACILDADFTSLYNTSVTNSNNLLGGMVAMPENTKYVALNTPSGSPVPNVTLVSESVIKTKDMSVPDASKFVASQKSSDGRHLYYWKDVEEINLIANWGADNTQNLYANGIYPLESGVEYVLYVPDSVAYGSVGYICNEEFNINVKIYDEDFDENRRYVFTASSNDKYIALNSYNLATIQFGENRATNISKSVNIGNAIFDGKQDITLKDMGVVDRSINKKFIAYGDSITRGTGVDFVHGEKRWTDYLVERYNIPEHINMGVGYSSLAMKEAYSVTPMSHDDRLNALIAESPDIVTILGGANDYVFNIPIGTNEDVTNKNRYTFKGAYAYIIDKILIAKPDTTIILLGMFNNTMGGYAEGKGAYPLKNYATATKEIAEYFGLPFVDLNECGFNSYNFNATDGVFSTDGIHPNAEGVKRIAMVVSKWFDTFKGTIFHSIGSSEDIIPVRTEMEISSKVQLWYKGSSGSAFDTSTKTNTDTAIVASVSSYNGSATKQMGVLVGLTEESVEITCRNNGYTIRTVDYNGTTYYFNCCNTQCSSFNQDLTILDVGTFNCNSDYSYTEEQLTQIAKAILDYYFGV